MAGVGVAATPAAEKREDAMRNYAQTLERQDAREMLINGICAFVFATAVMVVIFTPEIVGWWAR
jgi:hypothetical protein